MARIQIQDRLLTTGMGGVLPELDDPTSLHQVLDVGCDTGDCLWETARTYPSIEQLVGIDLSGKMIAQARALANAEHLADRVEFQEWDALRSLPFPNGSFDLVNQRLGAS
jgi:O-methyltransferase / aklanonic acid methyltransferase